MPLLQPVSFEVLRERANLIIIVPQEWVIEDFTMTRGNREKFNLISKQEDSPSHGTSRYMWKGNHGRYPVEFWSEVLAHQIASVIGIPTPVCFPAKLEDEYGSLSQFFLSLEDGATMYSGGDLVSLLEPTYDRKVGTQHTVTLVETVIKLSHKAARAAKVEQTYGIEDFFLQFLLDAIIGNSDRHQDNWAVVATSENLSLSKAFDNGSSLGREIAEGDLAGMLADDRRFYAYIDRGRHHIKWSQPSKHGMHHVELIEKLANNDSCRALLNQALQVEWTNIEKVIRYVAEASRLMSGPQLSSEREEFIVKLTRTRFERLHALL